MLFMILNPDIQTKVNQELIENFGNQKAKTSEKYKIPYTEAVIHEIQRRANVLPMSVFHCTNAHFEIGKYSVPPQTILIPFIGDVMHDPQHFPEPSKFQPERYHIIFLILNSKHLFKYFSIVLAKKSFQISGER